MSALLVAVTMTINEQLKCLHDLIVLPAAQKGVR
jgi:hypothetical protein